MPGERLDARMSINRRKFLTVTGLAAAAGVPIAARLIGTSISQTPRNSPSRKCARIAVGRDERVTLSDLKGDEGLVQTLLNNCVVAALDKKTPEDAWRSLFSSRDRVAIKTSCLPGRILSTNLVLVTAIIKGLRTAGVKDDNILIWERSSRELERAGFKLSRHSGVRCFGTDDAYESEPESFRSIGSCFSKIITRYYNAIISVPVLKDHDIAGVSLSLKNFFGAINNPNKYHGNNCDPYIAELNLHPHIHKKLRLVICDGLRAQCDGGPAYKPDRAWDYRGIIVGTDPVAVDWQGLQLIEKRRRECGMPTLKRVKREPKHIMTAAHMGVGTSDPEATTVVEI